MNEIHLNSLRQEFDHAYGCYRPSSGPCFYIASKDIGTRDYGRQRGYRFVAFVEAPGGVLREHVVLDLWLTDQGERRLLIGDTPGGDPIPEVGLERLKELLDKDYNTPRDEEIVLRSDSSDELFSVADRDTVLLRYTATRDEILQRLAELHARGERRISRESLLRGLCHDIHLINRALTDLAESKLVKDLNHTTGMKLAARGQAAVEAFLQQAENDVSSERDMKWY